MSRGKGQDVVCQFEITLQCHLQTSETSAQNARGKNFQKFTCSNFCSFTVRVLVMGRENFPLYGRQPRSQALPRLACMTYLCLHIKLLRALLSSGIFICLYTHTHTHTRTHTHTHAHTHTHSNTSINEQQSPPPHFLPISGSSSSDQGARREGGRRKRERVTWAGTVKRFKICKLGVCYHNCLLVFMVVFYRTTVGLQFKCLRGVVLGVILVQITRHRGNTLYVYSCVITIYICGSPVQKSKIIRRVFWLHLKLSLRAGLVRAS